MFQPQNMVANGLDIGEGVRHEDDSDAASTQLVDPAHTAVAEIGVAHRERLIHEEHLGIHVDGNGESQPHCHAARIRLHRLVDEISDLGELFDCLVAAVDFAFGEAEDGGVQINIVATGEFGVEARAQFEQRGDASVDSDFARGGLCNPGDELQGGALA